MERLREFFEAEFIRGEPDECWPWLGGTNGDYGRLGRTLAHRIAYQLAHPDENINGLLICHTCDNPLCVNHAHLFKGTHLDNNRDCASKGRNVSQKKTHCPQDHEYTSENTYISPDGERACKTCKRIRRSPEHKEYMSAIEQWRSILQKT